MAGQSISLYGKRFSSPSLTVTASVSQILFGSRVVRYYLQISCRMEHQLLITVYTKGTLVAFPEIQIRMTNRHGKLIGPAAHHLCSYQADDS